MSDRTEMQKIVEEALRELDLDYRPATLFEPSDQPSTWCVDFFDYGAPQFERTFQVCVEWAEGSSSDSVKAELKAKLSSRTTG
jgi:hypothetical protein